MNKQLRPTRIRDNKMKTALMCFMSIILMIGCSSSKKELYKNTDAFVQSLETTYESYGLLGGTESSVTTSDGLYTITPIGRLINVKIQKAVNNDKYESLRKDLENHYKNDKKVNKVYICEGGTIMIDCRN